MTFKQFVDRYGVSLGVVFALALVIATPAGQRHAAQRPRAGLGRHRGAVDGVTGQSDGWTPAVGWAPSATTGGERVDGAGDDRRSDGRERGGAGERGGRRGGGGSRRCAFGKGPDCDAGGRQKGISRLHAALRAVDRHRQRRRHRAGRHPGQGPHHQLARPGGPGHTPGAHGARLNDDPAKVKRAYQALFNYSNQHYQTYGRQVVFEELNASGKSDSDEAMTADAVKIATEKKALRRVHRQRARTDPHHARPRARAAWRDLHLHHLALERVLQRASRHDLQLVAHHQRVRRQLRRVRRQAARTQPGRLRWARA